jgi:formylmethanofuran dehydrogenase subunit E
VYIPESVLKDTDYQKCIEFHGHTCMGVTIGYLASKLALATLGAERSMDEELIVIVENDACCCDAIQVLTGCTFGKGNFFFKDHGKMAFIFASRTSDKALRLVLKPGVFDGTKEEKLLLARIESGKDSQDDIQRYEEISTARIDELFQRGPEAFFDVHEISVELPPTATRLLSFPCAMCNEMVMESRLEKIGNKMLCRGCR